MIADSIIACFVFVAFFRAAGEYQKNGVAWGFIGLASFFVPNFVIPFAVAVALSLAGAGRAVLMGFTVAGLAGFVAGLVTVVWVYNKLMERAIEEQAARDAQSLAPADSQGKAKTA
jgi:hypothetical protein